MHEMRPGANPGLIADLEREIGDALDGHQSAIGDTAGKDRRLPAKQSGTYHRIDTIGPDEDVGGDVRTVFEPCLDVVAFVLEAGETVAKVNALRRETRRNHVEQVGTMDRNVRRAVELFA